MNSNYTSLSDDLYGMPKGGPPMGGPPGGMMMPPPPPMPQGPPPPPRGPSELQHLRQMVQQMAAKINEMSGAPPKVAQDDGKPFTKFQTWVLVMGAAIIILLILLLCMFSKYAKKMGGSQVYAV